MEVSNNLTEKGQRDYQLIQRALQHQDQQAYTELLKHYRDPLYYMMLKMTGDPDDAEDLTIEAFGKAFQKPEALHSELRIQYLVVQDCYQQLY